jgi:hypothetical protein
METVKLAYQHGEAFMLMTYLCEDCGTKEKLWNTRDGVTPFCIDCRKCNGDMNHTDWNSDVRDAQFRHQFEVGMFLTMRVFVDAADFPRMMRRKATEYVNRQWEAVEWPMKNNLTNEHGAAMTKGQAIEFFVKDWSKDGSPQVVTAEEFLVGER